MWPSPMGARRLLRLRTRIPLASGRNACLRRYGLGARRRRHALNTSLRDIFPRT